jgi:hypothetical protein
VSQLLTLYTTPVMYLYVDRMRAYFTRKRSQRTTPSGYAPELPQVTS